MIRKPYALYLGLVRFGDRLSFGEIFSNVYLSDVEHMKLLNQCISEKAIPGYVVV